jgi:hypothetical protein
MTVYKPVSVNATEELVDNLNFLFSNQTLSESPSSQGRSHQKIKANSLTSKRFKVVNMTSKRLIIRKNNNDYRKMIAAKLERDRARLKGESKGDPNS